MRNKFGRGNSGDSRGCSGGDKSITDSNHKVVQHGIKESLEIHFPLTEKSVRNRWIPLTDLA